MKGMLFAVLMLHTVVWADPPTVSDEELEKYWSVFIRINHVPERATFVLQESGVSESGAKALATYVVEAMKELKESSKESIENICARKNELKASRNALADAVRQSDAQWNQARRGYIANLGIVLTPEDEGNLRQWMASREGPALGYSIDVDAKIRSGELDSQALIERSCAHKTSDTVE